MSFWRKIFHHGRDGGGTVVGNAWRRFLSMETGGIINIPQYHSSGDDD